MKILFISFALVFSALLIKAQEENNEMNYQLYADSVTANLDVSKIPHRILYDKVQPPSNLDIFVQGNDSTRSSAQVEKSRHSCVGRNLLEITLAHNPTIT